MSFNGTEAAAQVQAESNPHKRPLQNSPHGKQAQKPSKRQRKKDKKHVVQEGSHEEILLTDVQNLLASLKTSDDAAPTEAEVSETATQETALPEPGTELELEVVELSSTGDGLARRKGVPDEKHVYVVPFSIPGDVVKAKAVRHHLEEGYTAADFLSVIAPAPDRDDARIQCQYFGRCPGCQFQMLPYDRQLRVKREIIIKAYKNFSQLPPELVPTIGETIGSPLQYGYRTKLTPHFDGPPGMFRKNAPKKPLQACPPIGFTPKHSRAVLDIEDCPIATEAVRKGLTAERERMKTEYGNYIRGATILLRESTTRVVKSSPEENPAVPAEVESQTGRAKDVLVRVDTPTHVDFKTCVTDQKAPATEWIDNFRFTSPAGTFFQNNNSILSPFTAYIREHILPPPTEGQKSIRYLIDAYSGSGLFTITQSSLFPGGSIGIDISEGSILYARRNAAANDLPESRCRFVAADANELFKSVSEYDPDETVVVLDPPRKGCDGSFLRQLLRYGPRRVVYVSCNVHTQARDVGVLVRGVEGVKGRYTVESIRGFDFFPQTGHVESVAVLNRVDE